jgi:hypothetical protein
LAAEDSISQGGQWATKRTYGYLHMDASLDACSSMQDVNLLTNGEETTDRTWYITGYATKKQQKSHNRLALLVNTVAYHVKDSMSVNDIHEHNRLLLFQCAHAINQQEELAAPQVMAYLMGYDDSIKSHQYVPIYWSRIVRALLKAHLNIRSRQAT